MGQEFNPVRAGPTEWVYRVQPKPSDSLQIRFGFVVGTRDDCPGQNPFVNLQPVPIVVECRTAVSRKHSHAFGALIRAFYCY